MKLKRLEKIYKNKKIAFPYQFIEKNNKIGVTSITTFSNRKQIYSEILSRRNAKQNIYRCFFCNKFKKEDIGGRFMPMDKRESGDNGFGHTFACYKCVPKRFGRL